MPAASAPPTSTPSRGTTCRREELWPDLLYTRPELQYPERLNCVDRFLDRWVEEGRGGEPCLLGASETLTYAQVQERVNRLCNVLVRRLGLVPGNRVLLRSANNPMMAIAHLAVLKAGGIVVATMPLLRAKEIAFPIRKARIALALCDHRLSEEMERAKALAPELRARRVLGLGRARRPRGDDGRGEPRLRGRRHRGRRHLPDRLHLRHHRRAQGHDARPSRHARHLRRLRPQRAAA